MIIWLTGPSGAGKTTTAKAIKTLRPDSVIIDGDEVRQGLSSDLSHDPEHIIEDVRRIAEIAKLLNNQVDLVIVACMSPSIKSRDTAMKLLGEDVQLVKCLAFEDIRSIRDPKGFYSKGIDIKYEEDGGYNLVINCNEKANLMDNALRILSLC